MTQPSNDGSGVWWHCDGCGAERECAPLSHGDWGGRITVDGPDCQDQECLNFGCPMDFLCDETTHVFENCNVCGRQLHGEEEHQMGMCVVCAAE